MVECLLGTHRTPCSIPCTFISHTTKLLCIKASLSCALRYIPSSLRSARGSDGQTGLIICSKSHRDLIWDSIPNLADSICLTVVF